MLCGRAVIICVEINLNENNTRIRTDLDPFSRARCCGHARQHLHKYQSTQGQNRPKPAKQARAAIVAPMVLERHCADQILLFLAP